MLVHSLKFAGKGGGGGGSAAKTELQCEHKRAKRAMEGFFMMKND
jgi:hypothetical protein